MVSILNLTEKVRFEQQHKARESAKLDVWGKSIWLQPQREGTCLVCSLNHKEASMAGVERERRKKGQEVRQVVGNQVMEGEGLPAQSAV